MEAERTASQPESQSTSRQGSSTSQELIRRAPSGFLWYQAFIFWLFISNWLVTLVVRRTLSLDEAGVYGLVIGAANLAVYIASLGLGNAAAVFLPRALAEGGPGHAMAVALRLIVARLPAVVVLAAAVLWGLPLLANLLASINLPGATSLDQTLSDPRLTAHRLVLVAYLIGYGMTNLLAALLTALLRTKTVFLVNSLVQLAQIGLMYFVIVRLRAGADGAILAQALPVGLASLAYGFWLQRLLADHARPARAPAMGPILRLGIATALSD